MAGLGPAIHVFPSLCQQRHGCRAFARHDGDPARGSIRRAAGIIPSQWRSMSAALPSGAIIRQLATRTPEGITVTCPDVPEMVTLRPRCEHWASVWRFQSGRWRRLLRLCCDERKAGTGATEMHSLTADHRVEIEGLRWRFGARRLEVWAQPHVDRLRPSAPVSFSRRSLYLRSLPFGTRLWRFSAAGEAMCRAAIHRFPDRSWSKVWHDR